MFEQRQKKLWGLFSRKERWGLTLRGWAAFVLLLGAAGAAALWGIHPFLAVNRPLDTKLLVVEGWIPDYALEEGADIFRRDHYEKIFTTGGPSINTGAHLAEYDSYAQISAEHLLKLGLKPEQVQAVPSLGQARDRTYNSGTALREWLQAKGVATKGVNVVTLGPHARRTRLLFEKAAEGKLAIGIIAVENREYDPGHWWRYSEGVKEVLSETAAYLYARFFFHPLE